MKSNSFRYLIGQGVSGLWKNRMMTLASVGVLTACLLIVGFAVLLTENINQIVGYVESQNEMVAFLYKSGEEPEFVESVADVEAANEATALRIQQDFEESGQTEAAFRQSLIDSGITEEELLVLFGQEGIAAYGKPDAGTEDTVSGSDTASGSDTVSGSDAASDSDTASASAADGADDTTSDSGTASEPAEETGSEAADGEAADSAAEDGGEPLEGLPVVYWDGLIEDVEAQLWEIPNISDVRFVSKEEGLENQKESFGELSYLLDDYTGADNPIRNSFVLKVDDLSKMAETVQEVEDVYGIFLVNAANDVATTLTGLRRIINIVGWSIVAALTIVSLVIIINTIRASIFARRKELNIMKYVGATNSFIRLPFIVEGICLGVLSAAIAYLIIWAGYSYLMQGFMDRTTSWIKAAFQSIIPFEQVAPGLAGFFLVSAVALGVIGSLVSIRNHIRV